MEPKNQQSDNSPKPRVPRSNDKTTSSRVKAMVRLLEKTHDEEIPCDEVHAMLAQFAEAVTLKEDASQLMPLVQQHLDLCAGCREEFEAVLRILNAPNDH
jgi:hypothetical protein